MKLTPQWIRLSDSLILSQCQRYVLSRWMDFWYVAAWDGSGWELLGQRPAASVIEAKQRVNRHRFTRPLTKASA